MNKKLLFIVSLALLMMLSLVPSALAAQGQIVDVNQSGLTSRTITIQTPSAKGVVVYVNPPVVNSAVVETDPGFDNDLDLNWYLSQEGAVHREA